MVATLDSRPGGLGLVSPEAIPDNVLLDVIPDGDDDAVLADGEADDALASAEPVAPFDLDSLDDEQRTWLDTHYQSQAEAQHTERLAAAMRTRDRENNELRSARQQAESTNMALNAALGQAHQWLAQYAQQHGDELAYYQFRDATQGAMQTATQRQQQSQQEVVAWVAQEHNTILQKLQADSVGLDGQRLYDPNDPEIETARTAYLQAAYRDRSEWRPDGGYNPVRNQEALAALNHLQTLAKAKMLGGVSSKDAALKQAKAKEAARVAKARKDRGPQSTARGAGGGGMSGDAAWEAATKEYPSEPDKRHARYLQLKYGNPT